MSYCTECGRELHEGQNICPDCKAGFPGENTSPPASRRSFGARLRDAVLDSIEESERTKRVSYLLAIVGFAFIVLYLSEWASAAVLELTSTAQGSTFWRIFAFGLFEGGLYLVIGVSLCVLAAHVANSPPWRVVTMIALIAAAIGALVMFLGVIGFLLDIHQIFVLPFLGVNLVLHLLGSVLEIAALVAIIVVELSGRKAESPPVRIDDSVEEAEADEPLPGGAERSP